MGAYSPGGGRFGAVHPGKLDRWTGGLFYGSPFHPDPGVLWHMAAEERVTIFGTSAKYIAAMEKKVKAEIADAVEFAVASPYPKLEEATQGTFA